MTCASITKFLWDIQSDSGEITRLVTYFHLGLSWTTLNLARRRLIITDNRSVFPPALFAFLVCSTVLKTRFKMHPKCAIISKYLHPNVSS